jgi:hypothetical protein
MGDGEGDREERERERERERDHLISLRPSLLPSLEELISLFPFLSSPRNDSVEIQSDPLCNTHVRRREKDS